MLIAGSRIDKKLASCWHYHGLYTQQNMPKVHLFSNQTFILRVLLLLWKPIPVGFSTIHLSINRSIYPSISLYHLSIVYPPPSLAPYLPTYPAIITYLLHISIYLSTYLPAFLTTSSYGARPSRRPEDRNPFFPNDLEAFTCPTYASDRKSWMSITNNQQQRTIANNCCIVAETWDLF